MPCCPAGHYGISRLRDHLLTLTRHHFIRSTFNYNSILLGCPCVSRKKLSVGHHVLLRVCCRHHLHPRNFHRIPCHGGLQNITLSIFPVPRHCLKGLADGKLVNLRTLCLCQNQNLTVRSLWFSLKQGKPYIFFPQTMRPFIWWEDV